MTQVKVPKTKMKTFSPENVLISLFKYFPADEESRKIFKADREKLHRALFKLKKEDPKLFQEFTFNTYKLFPRSEELDQALSNLELSGYLGKFNPYLAKYEVKPLNDIYFEKNLDFELNEDQKDKLRMLARKFQEFLICDNGIVKESKQA
jgi:hypothetical protein